MVVHLEEVLCKLDGLVEAHLEVHAFLEEVHLEEDHEEDLSHLEASPEVLCLVVVHLVHLALLVLLVLVFKPLIKFSGLLPLLLKLPLIRRLQWCLRKY